MSSTVASLLGDSGRGVVRATAALLAVLAACGIASWVERHIYYWLLGRSRLARVLWTLLLPIGALTLWPLVAVVAGLASAVAGDGGVVVGALVLSSFWFAGAALGTIVIVLIDVVVSAVVADFRSRVQLAVLALLAVCSAYFVGVYAVARRLATLAASDPWDEQLQGMQIDVQSAQWAERIRTFAESPEAPDVLAAAALVLGVLVALPAILSATGKLADAVMERLNPLREAFDRVGAGDLGVRVEEGGSRELVTIGRGFNRMAASLHETLTALGERNRDLAETNRAAVRFVPFQFLELLRKQSIREIQRGDQIELEISVMFSDIRGFTTLAERMGPKDTFGFINRYVAEMEAAIHREQGFINDIVGDGIMALFHRGADAALRAAIGMTQAVAKLNEALEAEGREPITIGIGIHSGALMLGTIGGSDRLTCTVIGDPANAASRVEGMTKLYGARLLVTGETVERLQDARQVRLRELDRVQAKGKTTPLVIYEVLDAEPDPSASAKWSARERFAEALTLYRQGAFSEAHGRFAHCLAECPSDTAAGLYLRRAEESLARPPTSWDGVTRLETK